jgi:hypothetical protein
VDDVLAHEHRRVTRIHHVVSDEHDRNAVGGQVVQERFRAGAAHVSGDRAQRVRERGGIRGIQTRRQPQRHLSGRGRF